jgi:hypothetical protein
MKTIMKTLFVVMSSFALLTSANAGEMTVSGSAKATWSNISDNQSAKGIGIANELTFGASGDFGAGYTWNLAIALDPSTNGDTGTIASGSTNVPAGSAINDDTSLSIGIPGMGTLGINVSAGGFNAKYGWSADAYTVMSDTGASEGATYSNDLGGTANIQFATEAGLLPLGAVAQVGYGYGKKDAQSANTSGVAGSDSAFAAGLTVKPVDGLTVGATYHQVEYYNDGRVDAQDEQSGAAYAKYAMGPITIGYGKSWKAPNTATSAVAATGVEWYENTGYSIGYAVNENFTVSYSHEKNETNTFTSTSTTYDIGQNSYQVAYNLGGATLSLVRHETENAGYVNNADTSETLVALAMAF